MHAYLIADSLEDWFDRQPWAPYVVAVLFLIIGPGLVYAGYIAISRRVIRSQGKEITGGTAVLVGSLYCILGAVMAVMGADIIVKGLL